jgi:hypothetical protein
MTRMTTEPLMNPSRSQFLGLVSNLRLQHTIDNWEIRGILHNTDYWLWDSYACCHDTMARELGVDGYDDGFYINPVIGYPDLFTCSNTRVHTKIPWADKANLHPRYSESLNQAIEAYKNVLTVQQAS